MRGAATVPIESKETKLWYSTESMVGFGADRLVSIYSKGEESWNIMFFWAKKRPYVYGLTCVSVWVNGSQCASTGAPVQI